MKKFLLALFSILISLTVSAQSSFTDEDGKQLEQAIEYCDNGEPLKAIDIYNSLLKKYPDEWTLQYEKAYAYANKLNDYEKALAAISEIKDKEQTSPIVYSIEGTCYEGLGKIEDAIKAYDKGLEVFPESAKLHFDKGITYAGADMLSDAVDEFFISSDLDPYYSSNYFYLSLIIGQASPEVSTAISLAQVHILMEPNSERSHALSEFVYQLYNSAITLEDDKVCVAFTEEPALVDVDGVMEVPAEYRFQMYHEWDESEKILKEKGSFSISDLTRLRKHFLETCFGGGKNQDMLTEVFAFELEALEKGHWEAYNMWLLGYGDPDEANAWIEANDDKYGAFVDWFNTKDFMAEDDN